MSEHKEPGENQLPRVNVEPQLSESIKESPAEPDVQESDEASTDIHE